MTQPFDPYSPQAQGQPQPYQPQPRQPGKRRTWLWVSLAAVAVLAVCGIGSCAVFVNAADEAIKVAEPGISSSPQPKTTATTGRPAPAAEQPANDAPTDAKVGDTLNVTADGLNAQYTVSKVEQKAKDRYGMTPDHGTWLLVHLSVKVIEGETFACSCELAYVSKSGKVFEESFADFKSRTQFESADLKSGQNLDGWVIFDVPKPVAGGKIQLTAQNLFTDNEYGYWLV